MTNSQWRGVGLLAIALLQAQSQIPCIHTQTYRSDPVPLKIYGTTTGFLADPVHC